MLSCFCQLLLFGQVSNFTAEQRNKWYTKRVQVMLDDEATKQKQIEKAAPAAKKKEKVKELKKKEGKDKKG